ncbi:hydrolase [bacterium]|nr:hydrolase [bacterium]
MRTERSLLIAVDFDGTIVEDRYPGIGKPMPFAFETLKKMEEDGHRLLLWTYRTGSKLEEAVAFCKSQGLEFYAVNRSFPEEDLNDPGTGRKIHADLFIDDRNFGGFPGWGVVYQQLSGAAVADDRPPRKRKWFEL